MQCGTDMQCGGTQTRRQQERRGTPKPGRGAARGACFNERSAPRAPGFGVSRAAAAVAGSAFRPRPVHCGTHPENPSRPDF